MVQSYPPNGTDHHSTSRGRQPRKNQSIISGTIEFPTPSICARLCTIDKHENATGESEPNGLSPLFIPVPRGVAALLGYDGAARFVGMFWSHEANEVVLTDGRDRKAGASLRFLGYLGHQAVESELGDLNIGLFDEPATTWLVLDTKVHNMYYGPVKRMQEFLAKQHATDAVNAGGIQLRQEMELVFTESDPALDELRAFLDAFIGTWEAD